MQQPLTTKERVLKVLTDLCAMVESAEIDATHMLDPLDYLCDTLLDEGRFGKGARIDPRGDQSGETCWTIRRMEGER
jgi:hypothetical protein